MTSQQSSEVEEIEGGLCASETKKNKSFSISNVETKISTTVNKNTGNTDPYKSIMEL